jgi:hypothetical protein
MLSPLGGLCGCIWPMPLPLSSRPEHSLPLAEGNVQWRDLLSHAAHICRRMALIFVALLSAHFLIADALHSVAERDNNGPQQVSPKFSRDTLPLCG